MKGINHVNNGVAIKSLDSDERHLKAYVKLAELLDLLVNETPVIVALPNDESRVYFKQEVEGINHIVSVSLACCAPLMDGEHYAADALISVVQDDAIRMASCEFDGALGLKFK